MDDDLTTLREAAHLELLDVEHHSDLDLATAERVSDACDRVTRSYYDRMTTMPPQDRITLVNAVEHPTEASVARGALMLIILEEVSNLGVNPDISLQSVHDNLTEWLGNSHFFEIVDHRRSAESCVFDVYAAAHGCWLARWTPTAFDLKPAGSYFRIITETLQKRGMYEDEATTFATADYAAEHPAIVARILEAV